MTEAGTDAVYNVWGFTSKDNVEIQGGCKKDQLTKYISQQPCKIFYTKINSFIQEIPGYNDENFETYYFTFLQSAF